MTPVVVALAVLGGVGAGALAMGKPMAVLVVAIVPLPLALWRWPRAGVILMLATAATVEQVSYSVGQKKGAFTQSIPLFHSVVKGIGLNPFEILLGLVVIFWLMQGALVGSLRLPRSSLSKSIALLVVLVIFEFGVGLSRHGKFSIAVWEARPLLYLATMYVLGSSLLTTRKALRAVLWALVLGSSFKALQGVIIYVQTRHMSPRPQAILGHEEAFFFGLYIFLTLGLWIFQIKGRLRATATALLPLVLMANLSNSRRTSWAIIYTGMIVFLIVAYRCLPERRSSLRWITFVLVICGAVYFPAFWNHGNGNIAQPARALRSQIKPDARDLSSNLYRKQENANLVLNIRESHSLGKGYGVPIKYSLPIVDISGSDPFIAYVPHNGILYIWMRLGIIGEIAFLSFVGLAIIRACQLTKVADRELSMLGTFVICGLVAYVVQGYDDMGFFWFRIALCIGLLLGGVEAALRMERERVSVVAT
jgi:O-antigen ligase